MPLGNTTLITRCPDCLTAFRATPEQLAMRDGHVRCGNCGMVFDARANLLDPDTLQLLQPPPAEEDSAIPAGAPAEIAIQPHETSSAVTAAVTEPRDEFVHPHEDFHTGESEAVNPPVDPSVDALESPPSIATTPDEPPDEAPQQDVDNSGSPAPAEDEYNRAEEAHLDDGPMVEDHAASAVIAQDPMGESHAAPDSALAAEAIPERPDDRGPESATEDATDQTQALATATPMSTPMPTPLSDSSDSTWVSNRRPGATASLPAWVSWPAMLVLLVLLAGQVAFRYRGDLVLLFPGMRPWAELACSPFNCDIPMPRRAELMSIESSDLQADSSNPGVMVLSATLRNRAPFAQMPPALELTLTDTQDQPVARRVLTASDYFARSGPTLSSGDALFPAGAELPVKVFFEASALKATGYRLYLFYP